MKTYSTKAAAKIGAKRQKLVIPADAFYQADGRWAWEDQTPVIGEFTYCPECGVHLDNGVMDNENWLEELESRSAMMSEKESDEAIEHMRARKKQYGCLGCGEDFGPACDLSKGTHVISKKSTIDNPCQLVWTIAEDMAGQKRKAILEECVKQGVAYNTARTQYQQWRTAVKNMNAQKEA